MGLTWILSLILTYTYSFREDFDSEALGTLAIFAIVLVIFSIIGLVAF